MGFYVGRGRKARRAFGFDEVAIVPGRVTINPEEVDTTWELGKLKFNVPILAAAMERRRHQGRHRDVATRRAGCPQPRGRADPIR